jgi:hypothetical protein
VVIAVLAGTGGALRKVLRDRGSGSADLTVEIGIEPTQASDRVTKRANENVAELEGFETHKDLRKE